MTAGTAVPRTGRALPSVVVPCFVSTRRPSFSIRTAASPPCPAKSRARDLNSSGSTTEAETPPRDPRAKSGTAIRVRMVVPSRNLGHRIAVGAGPAEAGGDAVAVIDADPQDPSEVLLRMLEHWRDGADVVHGVRSAREGETALKRRTASAFCRLPGRLADVPIPPDTGDFRACGPGQVEADRALVAVDPLEMRRLAVGAERRPPAAGPVALRRLHLDRVGAVVGPDHRAVGTARHAGAVRRPGSRPARNRPRSWDMFSSRHFG